MLNSLNKKSSRVLGSEIPMRSGKKLFLLSALCFLSLFSFAQKPEKNSVSAEVQLNFQTGTAAISVLSPALKGRFFIKNNLAARLSLGITGTTTTTNYTENPDGTGGIGKEEKSSNKFTIAAGVEKHFKGTERLSPFIGAEIAHSSGVTDEIARSNYDGTNYAPDFIQNILPGTTTTTSFNILLGADYYFVNHVYLGVEVSWGYQTGSTAQGEDTIFSNNINSTTVTPSSDTHGWAVAANSGIRLGFVF